MREDELRELFGEMRNEGVPAESLARVRMAVGQAVQGRRRVFGAVWKVAIVLAAAGCLAVVMLRERTVAPAVQIPVAAEQSAPVVVVPPVAQALVPAVSRLVSTPVRCGDRGVGMSACATSKPKAAPVDDGASEIRIESPLEPDVVIILIGG